MLGSVQMDAGRGRFHIITQGCQMNVRDSEAMAALLAGMGYQPADTPDDADIILLNTCTIREGADDKAYGRLGELRALKRKRSGLILGIAGCLVQKERERVRDRAPYLDLVFGVHNIHRLPELIRQVRDGCMAVYEVWDRSERDPAPRAPGAAGQPGARVRQHHPRLQQVLHLLHCSVRAGPRTERPAGRRRRRGQGAGRSRIP